MKEGIQMFGISKATWLKKDIIELLDKQDDYVSSQYLASKLTYTSVETIKKMCRELKEEIETIYQAEEAEFIIHKHHGIRFLRHSIHTQDYVDFIYSKELAYEIFIQTFLNESIDTYDFCESVHISESKLRRKVKEINHYTTVYDVQFSCTSTLSVTGPEHKIRMLGAIFLFTAHRSISRISVLTNAADYIQRTKQIFDYLNISYTTNLLHTVALYVLLTERRLCQHSELTQQEHELFHAVLLPPRPNFLTHWTDVDWRLLLLTYDAFDIVNLTSVVDYTPVQQHLTEEVSCSSIWFAQFEQHFRPLAVYEQQWVQMMLTKNYIASTLFYIDFWLVATFQSIDFERLKERFPLYMEKFDCLWDHYATAMTLTNSDHFRAIHLTMCSKLIALDSFIPTVRVFYYCDFTLLYQDYAKHFLQSHFAGRFILHYVDTPEEADVNIICTIMQQPSNKPTVFIRSQMPANDLLQIEKLLMASVK